MSDKTEKIYVVGFPKSGNTWLTRLLADILNCQAGSGMSGEHNIEIASYVNLESCLNQNQHFKILKTHLLPENQQRIDNEINKVVYIKRDFKDVLISAFFYKNKINENNVKLLKYSQLVKKSPKEIYQYFINRYRLWKLLFQLSKRWSDSVGGWSENYTEWKKYQERNPQISIIFITYEDLLKNTEKEIKKILIYLNIPAPTPESLRKSIHRQSFKIKRESLKKLPENTKIPLGREFNINFMRKGTAGDWENFLSKKMIKTVKRLHGKNTHSNTDLILQAFFNRKSKKQILDIFKIQLKQKRFIRKRNE